MFDGFDFSHDTNSRFSRRPASHGSLNTSRHAKPGHCNWSPTRYTGHEYGITQGNSTRKNRGHQAKLSTADRRLDVTVDIVKAFGA